MKNIKYYIFPILTLVLLLINIWWIINLKNDDYIKELTNIDLIQKQIWIDTNITISVLTINAIFIVILALKHFYFNKPIYVDQKKN